MAQAQKNAETAFCRGCLAEVSNQIGEKDGYALLKCASCGTVVVDPFPSLDVLEEYYASYKKTSDYLRKKDSKIKRIRRRVARMVKTHPKGKRFLDVGCSIGYTAPAAAPFDVEVKGIDVDQHAIDIANKEFGEFGSFEAITVEDYAARGEKADMIYAVEVIEHVPNPETFVKAMSEILEPNGILYVTAPDGGHFRVPKDFASWDMVCPPEHLTYFTRKGLETLLERYGLKIEKYQISFKPGIKAIARKI